MATLHPLYPLAGGLLIGLSAAVYLLFNGRIAGISGQLALAAGWMAGSGRALAVLFVLGLLVGAAASMAWLATPAPQFTASIPLLLAGGVLVGFGTRLGSGCTSGHGVCGIARLSRRSILATIVFMAVAVLTVYVMRHVLGV